MMTNGDNTAMYTIMRWTISLLALPLLLSCSNKPPNKATQQQPPSLEIRIGGKFEFAKEVIQVFRLIPKDNPRGEISLKSIQNGHVETLKTIRFKGMCTDGSLAVKLADANIELAISAPYEPIGSIPGDRVNLISWPPECVPVPAKETRSASGSSDCNCQPGDPEYEFWHQVFVVGKMPSIVPGAHTLFEDHVIATKKSPTTKAYVLTVKLDQTARQSQN
jgi:hypothetical protein